MAANIRLIIKKTAFSYNFNPRFTAFSYIFHPHFTAFSENRPFLTRFLTLRAQSLQSPHSGLNAPSGWMKAQQS